MTIFETTAANSLPDGGKGEREGVGLAPPRFIRRSVVQVTIIYKRDLPEGSPPRGFRQERKVAMFTKGNETGDFRLTKLKKRTSRRDPPHEGSEKGQK
jgi:hypothetical protein